MNNEDDTIVDNAGSGSGKINFATVEGLKFEVYPRGDYKIVISKCEYGFSKASNKPMWNMQLEILEGDLTGKKIFTFLSFSPNALPGTKTALLTIAPELANSEFDPEEVAAKGDLLGRKFTIRLDIKPYEGENRNQVKRWLKADAENEFVE